MNLFSEPRSRGARRALKPVAAGGVALAAVLAVIGGATHTYRFWDDDPDRGAFPIPAADALGEGFARVVYLDQGWSPADSLWFYTISQGSNLLPYDFFLVLEQTEGTRPFRDADNVNAYRYLPQRPTFSNPDGLPVGFVRDTYQGRDYVGLTCAACHTGQIHYRGTAIRIDGGPAGADMQRFMEDLARALNATRDDPAKHTRFVDAVLALGHYGDAAAVDADLATFAQRAATYAAVNHPTTPYRYGRLDAFGRIYNRLLEHVMSGAQLKAVLARVLGPDELDTVLRDAAPVLSAEDRDHVMERVQPLLGPRQLLRLRNAIFNPANAPVSYPFLWDTPVHDYVQWNGLTANAGIGPITRNAGEVIGVFGTLDWRAQHDTTLATLAGGQRGGVYRVDYRSSANVGNLRRIAHHLHTLTSPQWPEAILGAIDRARAARGARLYADYCIACHDLIERDDPDRRVIAQMTDVDWVGTDPKMADNSVAYQGYSGILRNLYVGTGVGDLLIQRRAPAVALLSMADRNVVATPDADQWIVRAWAERLYDFAITWRDNVIQPSIKQGHYTPDTTADPFASLRAYKARPLNGIWATAPYLHNGAVPTLYDLLLPVRRDGDPEATPGGAEYRPDGFKVGAREFDPEKVGFRTDVGDYFGTGFAGNGNAGHEYAAGRTPRPDGRTLPALDREQRLDLLEFLKTL